MSKKGPTVTDEERAREIAYNARVENLGQEELVSLIVALVQSEREACAKIADQMAIENKQGIKNAAADYFTTKMLINECAAIAAAIRTRHNSSK